jgi:primosomal protein N' (replication factor Y)
MVTKGHDVPRVTLVGVILADQSLVVSRFSRRTSARSSSCPRWRGEPGRAEKPGHVIFQTYQPEHQSIVAAAKHDYAAFYAREIADREEVGYSPFARMVSVRVDAGDEATASRSAQMLAELAGKHPCVEDGSVFVLGPAPAPILRLRGRYRYRVLLRGQERPRLRAVAERVLQRIEEGIAPARATVDVDPVAML